MTGLAVAAAVSAGDRGYCIKEKEFSLYLHIAFGKIYYLFCGGKESERKRYCHGTAQKVIRFPASQDEAGREEDCHAYSV